MKKESLITFGFAILVTIFLSTAGTTSKQADAIPIDPNGSAKLVQQI